MTKGKSSFLVPLFSTWEIINVQLFAPVQADCTHLIQGHEGEGASPLHSQGCREVEASLFPQVCVSPKQWCLQVYNSSRALFIFSRETAFNEHQQDFSLSCFWDGVTGAHALRWLWAGILLAHNQGSESVSEKYFERWCRSPNMQDNDGGELENELAELKQKHLILSALLIYRHQFPPNNSWIAAGLQPRGMPRSRETSQCLGILYLSPTPRSFPACLFSAFHSATRVFF